MNKPKLALSMLCYKETDKLSACLDSILPYVDKAFILQTSDHLPTTAILKAKGVEYKRKTDIAELITKKEIAWLKKFFGYDTYLKQGDRIFVFDKARNEAMKMVPKEYKYVMWVDADDIFRGGKDLHKVIEQMEKEQATAAFMNYLYDVEIENGKIKNILIEHLRERVVLNDGRYRWVAPIHETLIPKSGEVRQIEIKGCDVVHMSDHEQKKNAIVRNMKVLEHSIYQTQGKDPRPLYYLAKAYYDLHTPETHNKAEMLIYMYLQGKNPSGWAEERTQAWDYLADIYRERKEYNKAIKASLNALTETNRFPTTYLSLAQSYMHKQRWDEALLWLTIAGSLPMPKTTLVVNPRDMIAKTLEVLANCNLKLSKLDEAWAASVKLVEMFPKDEHLVRFNIMLNQMRAERELTKSFVQLAKHLEATGQGSRIPALLSSAPIAIKDNPIVSDLAKRYIPPKKWGDNEVAIYCGAGWTAWNPDDIKKQTGNFVGGSEEAVIYAAKELSKYYKVTVYADPGEERVYDGVMYKNYFQFNPNDDFNILVGWRVPQVFENNYNAKQTYLWLHDVPNPIDFTQKRLANISKIFVLSKAHRELLPGVPDEKFFITSNGYTEHFPEAKFKRDNKRCIWTSSYDRGIQHLLEMWPEIRKNVEDVTLYIYYGWQLFDKFYANNPERMAWKQKIEGLMKQDGIHHMGRLGQVELEKEIKKAGVWVYPTDFYEINCISAIKAQAFGAIPVVTNHAALKETVQFGAKVQGDIWDAETKKFFVQAWTDALVSEQRDRRTEMMAWAKKKYSWSSIIKSWVKLWKNHSK